LGTEAVQRQVEVATGEVGMRVTNRLMMAIRPT
jgi:hypothetical protein